MELNKNQWYVRWFFLSLMVWDEFRETDSSWDYRHGTNLCHFIRVMLVWCPLVVLLNLAVYASGIAVLTAIPVYFFGGVAYAWLVGAIFVVVLFILAIKALGNFLEDRQIQKNARAKREQPKPAKAPKAAAAQPSFFTLLWRYLVATKQKVCPTITFNHQTQGAE